MRRRTLGFALAGIVLVVASCNAPFTPEVLSRAEDTAAPTLEVESPEDQSFYARSVLLSGSVADWTNDEDVAGEIRSLRYEIPAASISEEIELNDDGTFSVQFSTSLFSGDTISLVVIAEDTNGNTTSRTITLLYGGSDIASFAVAPGNQRATLSWEPVPGASGYTVRNLGEGAEVELAPDSSSHEWTGLTNGSTYFFEIESTDGLGQTNTSGVVATTPLSPYTLLPRAESYADGVRLTWRPMPGVARYVIEKAESIDGPYFRRDVTTQSTYRDTNLARDTFYYYRVYPEGQPAIKSAPVEGILVPYSTAGSEPGDYFGPMTSTRYIVAHEGYLFVDEREPDGSRSIVVIDASDPNDLIEVARVNTGSASIMDFGLDASADILYLATEEVGVKAVDIADPLAATMLSVTNAALGFVDSFASAGIEIAYVGASPYLVHVDLEGPVYVAAISRSGSTVTLAIEDSIGPHDAVGSPRAGALAISGTTAYVTVKDSNGHGFDRVDFSSPGALTLDYSYRTANGGTDAPGAIAVTGSYVYLGYETGAGDGAIDVVADDPTPSRVNRISLDREVVDLIVSDGLVYASSLTDGVIGYDAAASVSGATPLVQADTVGSAQGAAVVGGYLVASGLSGVESFELLELITGSTPRVSVDETTTSSSLTDFTSVGDDAHFVHRTRVYPMNLSNMGALTSLSGYEPAIPGGGQAIFQGNRQIITDDYPSPANDLVATSVPGESPAAIYGSTGGVSSTYYSIGDYTYGYSGATVAIHDTSELATFPQLRSIVLEESVRTMLSQENRLYTVSATGFTVFDISDPLNPVEIHSEDVATDRSIPTLEISDAALHDDRLYLVFHDENGTPAPTNGSTPTGGADDQGGFFVYSVSDPSNPGYLGGLIQGAEVYSDYGSEAKRFASIVVTGHLAILSSGSAARGVPDSGGSEQYEGRIEMFNVSDPGSIYKIKDILPSGSYVPTTTGNADFPRGIHLFRNRYLFVYGDDSLSYFEL